MRSSPFRHAIVATAPCAVVGISMPVTGSCSAAQLHVSSTSSHWPLRSHSFVTVPAEQFLLATVLAAVRGSSAVLRQKQSL